MDGSNIYQFVRANPTRLVDPLGLQYSEVIKSVPLSEITRRRRGADMVTGHVLVLVGDERKEVVETKVGSCWCASVQSPIQITVVTTTLHPESGVIGISMTANGFVEGVKHEERRRRVKSRGYMAYLAPANTSLAMKCGQVCHKTKGFAKILLQSYLVEMRDDAIGDFERYDRRGQGRIDIENDERRDQNDESIDDALLPGQLFDHFNFIPPIRDLDDPTKTAECPISKCSN